MEQQTIITWVKCHHGVEKRNPLGCEQCRKEKDNFLYLANKAKNGGIDKKIPITRGCKNKTCFCNGSCMEVIGYREPMPHEI